MAQARIRVFYPRSSGRIVLRTDLDWDRDVENVRVEDGGARWEFVVDTDRPYFYFKPVLREDGGALRWSVGSNYLAVATTAESRDLYPHFFDGTNGDITHPLEVPRAPGRRVRVYQPPGYDENTLKRYPVLYMHDGTNLFFPDESFQGETWEIEQTMHLSMTFMASNMSIVCSISHVSP